MADLEPHSAATAARSRLPVGWRARVRRVLSAPFLRFVVVGGLLFALDATRQGARPEPLRVTESLRAQLEERFRLEHGRSPNEAERRAMLEQWATEEALVRHARELGLDEKDAVVRRRLIQDVEFLLEAQADPATEQQLRVYFEAHRERYAQPAQRSFEHVFVAGRGSEARARASELLERLRHGAQPASLGDPSVHGTRLVGLTKARLAAKFGAALAEQAFALERERWSEPLASPLGLHVLRVVEQRPARTPSYAEVREQVLQDQAAHARERALEAGKRALRERYALDVPP